MQTSFNYTYFKERNNMAVAPNLWAMIMLCKKQCLPVITWNKSIHRSKLYQLYTHLEETFLQLLILMVCETFLLRESRKHFGLYESS